MVGMGGREPGEGCRSLLAEVPLSSEPYLPAEEAPFAIAASHLPSPAPALPLVGPRGYLAASELPHSQGDF